MLLSPNDAGMWAFDTSFPADDMKRALVRPRLSAAARLQAVRQNSLGLATKCPSFIYLAQLTHAWKSVSTEIIHGGIGPAIKLDQEMVSALIVSQS